MQPEDEKPMPALWGYTQRVYSAMEDEAEAEELPGEVEEGEDQPTGLVYTGHLTSLFQTMAIPNPYYTHVTRMLKAMGCIQQLRRGGGPSMSKWLLIAPPTEEAFLEVESGKSTMARKGKVAALEQRIRDLNKRVTVLEDITRKGAKVT